MTLPGRNRRTLAAIETRAREADPAFVRRFEAMATALLPDETPPPGQSSQPAPSSAKSDTAGWVRFCCALGWLAFLTVTVAVTTTSTADPVLKVALWSWVLGLGMLFLIPLHQSGRGPQSSREQLP
ncbi:MAG TPA: hypothetical protein VHX59_21840 [Mycobacteriales bacterium]|jgi:hypothetical protein|nr:hypothetical protein [Mycobacteriales bacterium]